MSYHQGYGYVEWYISALRSYTPHLPPHLTLSLSLTLSAVDGFSNISANSAFGSNSPAPTTGGQDTETATSGVSSEQAAAARQMLDTEAGSTTQVDQGVA